MNPLIIILSNRGPFSFQEKEDGTFAVIRGAGGLVTALGALAEQHEVLWIASAISEGDQKWADSHEGQSAKVEGIELRLLPFDEETYRGFYNSISNPLLWFIQHQLWDIPRTPSITSETWKAWNEGYKKVNRAFADAVVDSVSDLQGSERPIIVFPQDYHLYLVPHFLREALENRIYVQPFVHIPWPGPDAWHVLPKGMREFLLSSLLASDQVGFQTEMDAFNFVQTCRFYLTDAHSRGSRNSIHYKGRRIQSRVYPISIDIEKVTSLTEEPQTRLLKSQLINYVGDHQMILRVDRIEPSKNILRGLKAYREMLRTYPDLMEKVVMLALLVPSRMEVEQYQDYLGEIMAEAGMINAEFSDAFWEPIRTVVGDNYPRAIAAMQLYDVLLVNPIADGMNLVAKEGVLVNQKDGMLILSEHAGAIYELGEYAIEVSPFDIQSTAEALYQALTTPPEERRTKAENLRDIVKNAGVKRWFYAQVEDALNDSSNQFKNSSTPNTP